MKLGRITHPLFGVTLEKVKSQEPPLRAAFALKGISKKYTEEMAKYEEVRQAALKKYANKKEDGSLELNESNNAQFSQENWKLFAAEIEALHQTDIELGTIKISDLGDKMMLSVDDLMVLDSVIVG